MVFEPSKKILIATSDLWDYPSIKVGDHHYAEHFIGDKWNLFWINHTISPIYMLKFLKRNNFWKLRIKDWLCGVREKNGALFCTPFTLLPYNKKMSDKEWIGKNNLRFTLPSVKNVLNKHGFSNVDILWITDLSAYYLTKIIRYRKLVLRLVDDVPMYSNSPASITILQHDLIRKADYVFVTSKNLMKYQNSDSQNFFYIPNGVNIEHFKRDYAMPAEYHNIASPRILFLGAINDWFDIDLMHSIAREMPDYNFILIGPSGIDVSQLGKNENIFIMGPRNYDEIPAYMKYADVGIIPFKQNRLTQSVSPIKMFEYSAAGLPIVAVRLQEAESLSPPAYFANTPTEFRNYVESAYKKGKNRPECHEFAEKHSWKARFENIKKILSS